MFKHAALTCEATHVVFISTSTGPLQSGHLLNSQITFIKESTSNMARVTGGFTQSLVPDHFASKLLSSVSDELGAHSSSSSLPSRAASSSSSELLSSTLPFPFKAGQLCPVCVFRRAVPDVFQSDSLCDSFLDSMVLLAAHRLLLSGLVLADTTESFVVVASL